MKRLPAMAVIIPTVLIFLIACILVGIFTFQNPGTLELRYHLHIPFLLDKEWRTGEVSVAVVVLMSFFFGVLAAFLLSLGAALLALYPYLKRKRAESREQNILTLRARAKASSLMGEYDKAIADYQKILKRMPDEPEFHLELAEVYRQKQDYKSALEQDSFVLSKDPENISALLGAAEDWTLLGNFIEAIKTYRKVLEINYYAPAVIRKLLELQEKAGLYEEAIETFARIRSRSKADQRLLASLYYRLGLRQRDQGEKEKARSSLESSLEVMPNFVPAILALTDLYLSEDQQKNARKIWEKSLENTLSTVVLKKIEDYYYQQGKPQQAIALYQDLLTKQDLPQLKLALARLYLRLEMREQAEEKLLDLQAKNPEIPQIYYLLATLYQRSSKTEAALEAYQTAMKLTDSRLIHFECEVCKALYDTWRDYCHFCNNWGTLMDFLPPSQESYPLTPVELKQLPAKTVYSSMTG
jgi:tetratricopeptide (TPR) repeat protein